MAYNELMHWENKNHKYIKREWKNGGWQYYYGDVKNGHRSALLSGISKLSGANARTNYKAQQTTVNAKYGNEYKMHDSLAEKNKTYADRANRFREAVSKQQQVGKDNFGAAQNRVNRSNTLSGNTTSVRDSRAKQRADEVASAGTSMSRAYSSVRDTEADIKAYNAAKAAYDKTLMGIADSTIKKGRSKVADLIEGAARKVAARSGKLNSASTKLSNLSDRING